MVNIEWIAQPFLVSLPKDDDAALDLTILTNMIAIFPVVLTSSIYDVYTAMDDYKDAQCILIRLKAQHDENPNYQPDNSMSMHCSEQQEKYHKGNEVSSGFDVAINTVWLLQTPANLVKCKGSKSCDIKFHASWGGLVGAAYLAQTIFGEVYTNTYEDDCLV